MNMVIRWCLMLMTLVHQSVNSQRLVVNTTCLELAKSSNQQLRLSCDNPDNYHCLIDGSNTREYEVCRVWKWISKGNSQQNLILFNHKTVRCLQCTKAYYCQVENPIHVSFSYNCEGKSLFY